MLRSLIWYFRGYLWTLIEVIPQMRQVDRLEKEGRMEERAELIAKTTNQIAYNFFKYTKSTVHVEGLENIPEGPVLFVGNHQSNLDIPVIMYYINRPKGFIAKQELEKIPLQNKWMRFTESIFIDRSNPKKAMSGILRGIDLLKKGYSMVVFPEGTRSKSSKMASFKAGSFKLATKSKVPIVPFTIDGAYNIMEANKNIIKPAHVDLYVHPPIYTDNLTREEQANLHNVVEDIVRSKLPNQGR